MLIIKVILFFFLFWLTTPYAFCETGEIPPPFPRIANVYGANLRWADWSIDGTYLQKISLLIGGGWDFWYDWDMPDKIASLESSLSNMTTNITNIKTANPKALVLPYVLVDNALDNPLLPSHWWRLDDEGQMISLWPGIYQIKYELPEVLEYNLEKVTDVILSNAFFDGIFYDSWGPDNWLVSETVKLRNGKAIVMFNSWNLPGENFDKANGALSEDEINRIIDGDADFENFLNRYIRWTSECRKPAVTTIVCHPRSAITDPWIWNSMTDEEKATEIDKARLADEQTMRFGLVTALMGDGYFAYDYGVNRGGWWWYKEYDAHLGYPKGVAYKNSNGTWQRDYEGGTVIVNGTHYDAVIQFSSPHTDASTEEIAQQFTLPSFDGRIFSSEQVSGCTHSIGDYNAHYYSPGGTGNVNVITSDNQCSWTATSNTSWVTVTSGSSGTGSGSVNYSVSANTATTQRTGTLTIAGQTFTITQQGISCAFTISPASNSFNSSEGTGSVNVTAQSGCSWTATSNTSWVTVTSGSSGTGSGSVNYSVSANTATTQRTGTLTIAGQTFTVIQEGKSISTNWSDVISQYNDYVNSQATWSEFIATYQGYAVSQQ
jgi:hypothetical protein